MIPPHVHERTLRSFLHPVVTLLDDPHVSEILINGPGEVYVERAGALRRDAARFESREALMAALRTIAQLAGRPLGPRHPVLEARLPDGSRVEAVLPPAAPQGPMVAIRRFSGEKLTLRRLLAQDAVDPDTAELLATLVACKQNVLVSGGTGSGKTSLLNVLSSFVPEGERIVVIEDARELQLQGGHVVQLETVAGDARGRGQLGIRDLFRASLRMRPDRIVVGEIRAGEALDLVQAMTSGHGGCLSTIHASHPMDALHRLETLSLMSDVALPLSALRAQIMSAVDIIVQTARLRDGTRRITHVSEAVAASSPDGYRIREICRRRCEGGERGTVPSSVLEPCGGPPSCVERIHDMGMRLPRVFYEARRSSEDA